MLQHYFAVSTASRLCQRRLQ